MLRGNSWEWLIVGCLLLSTAPAAALTAEDEKSSPAKSGESRATALEALEHFNVLVGEWRGVGRPKRNSTADAWFEKGEWVWEIRKNQTGLRYTVKDPRQIASALLTYDSEQDVYVLEAILADKSVRRYTGTLEKNRLTLATEAGEDGRIHQVEIKMLSEKRTVLIYQSRLKAQQQFSLVAEVGYTREGTRLAEEGLDGPECIVTGGKGTMSTVYKGQTYWFCCTGCRDAFTDDPDGIIAAYKEKQAKKKRSGEKPGS
jgi:YHS domain-containing protein